VLSLLSIWAGYQHSGHINNAMVSHNWIRLQGNDVSRPEGTPTVILGWVGYFSPAPTGSKFSGNLISPNAVTMVEVDWTRSGQLIEYLE
jgi:hypothetical protein